MCSIRKSFIYCLKKNKKMDLYHPNSKVVIGWTPKCACTVILKMFLDHCGLLETALNYDGWVHNYRERFLEPCPIDLNNILRIKFIRNPYSRAVSSYLTVCRFRKDFPMLKDIEHLSFETFLEYLVSPDVQWDFHYIQQFKKGEKYDEVIRIENIDHRMTEINLKYGLNLNWKFTSSHHILKHPNIDNGYQGNIDYYKNFDLIGSYKEFYNETNRKFVETVYASDFLHYGYTYDDFLLENI